MRNSQKSLIAECEARETADRAAARDRNATTFCHHGKNLIEHCAACDNEEAGR